MLPAQNGLPADEASGDAAPAAHQGEGWEGRDLVDGDPRDPEDEDMRSAGPTCKLGLYSGAHDISWPRKWCWLTWQPGTCSGLWARLTAILSPRRTQEALKA